jgi:hypothetical protein
MLKVKEYTSLFSRQTVLACNMLLVLLQVAVSDGYAYTSGKTENNDPLRKPSNLVAVTAQQVINLHWMDNSKGETSFQVERSLSATEGFTVLAVVPANTVKFSDVSTPARNTRYYYRVRALQVATNSDYSEVASAYVAGTWLTGSSTVFVINNNVGIGTPRPDAQLTVKGSIYAEAVRVFLNVPGPDYVFETNYPLMPLDTLRHYIDAKRHLPEIPDAATMKAEGVNQGEMTMLLLKKVEELTLYILEKEKRISALEENAKR